MADFPTGGRSHKPVISSASAECMGLQQRTAATPATPVSATWPSANLALYIPLTIWAPYPTSKVWWANGSAVAGNVDCGVYTADGVLLFAAGSTAQSGTNIVQSVTLGTTYLLLPGFYYLALSASSTSTTFFRSALAALAQRGQILGMAQQATALPLPATFTLAALTQIIAPLCGIARAAVI